MRRQCSHLLTPSARFTRSSSTAESCSWQACAHAVDERRRPDALQPPQVLVELEHVGLDLGSDRLALRAARGEIGIDTSELLLGRAGRLSAPVRRVVISRSATAASASSCSRSSIRASSSSSRSDRRLRMLAISCCSASSSSRSRSTRRTYASARPAPSASSSRSRVRSASGRARAHRAAGGAPEPGLRGIGRQRTAASSVPCSSVRRRARNRSIAVSASWRASRRGSSWHAKTSRCRVRASRHRPSIPAVDRHRRPASPPVSALRKLDALERRVRRLSQERHRRHDHHRDQCQHQRVFHGGRAPVLQHPVADRRSPDLGFEYSRRIMRSSLHVGRSRGRPNRRSTRRPS